MTATIEQVTEEVRHLDASLDPDEDAFKVAVILLSSVFLGPDVEQIAAFTGFAEEYVNEVGQRFSASGIWEDGRVGVSWADGGEDSGIAFWLDVLVGQGLLARADPPPPDLTVVNP